MCDTGAKFSADAVYFYFLEKLKIEVVTVLEQGYAALTSQ